MGSLLLLTEQDMQSPHCHGPVMGDSAVPVSWIWGHGQGAKGQARNAIDFWVKEGTSIYKGKSYVLNDASGQCVKYHLASANATRWKEEVLLVSEEMKQTIWYFGYHVKHW